MNSVKEDILRKNLTRDGARRQKLNTDDRKISVRLKHLNGEIKSGENKLFWLFLFDNLITV